MSSPNLLLLNVFAFHSKWVKGRPLVCGQPGEVVLISNGQGEQRPSEAGPTSCRGWHKCVAEWARTETPKIQAITGVPKLSASTVLDNDARRSATCPCGHSACCTAEQVRIERL